VDEMAQITVRITPATRDALKARAERERRPVTQLARLILEDALLPKPDQPRRVAEALSRQARKVTGIPAAVEVPDASWEGSALREGHEFTAQKGNPLRCTCGIKKADHSK